MESLAEPTAKLVASKSQQSSSLHSYTSKNTATPGFLPERARIHAQVHMAAQQAS